MDTFRFETPERYRLGRTFSTYRMGPGDPSLRIDGSRLSMARTTPAGPVRIDARQDGRVLTVSLTGAGRDWVQPHLVPLLGLADDPSVFQPEDRNMRHVWKRTLGIHLPTLPVVFNRLVQVVLLQLVTTKEACRAWRRIALTLGSPAPGSDGLVTPPDARTLAAQPWSRFVADGVPHRQARTLSVCARAADRIEASAREGREALSRTLLGIRGVGPWSDAYMAGTAMGDPDAVLVGDHTLPHTAAWVLGGRRRGSDDELLRLLEPYRGHRFRVIRALWSNGVKAPRRGPKRAPRPLPEMD